MSLLYYLLLILVPLLSLGGYLYYLRRKNSARSWLATSEEGVLFGCDLLYDFAKLKQEMAATTEYLRAQGNYSNLLQAFSSLQAIDKALKQASAHNQQQFLILEHTLDLILWEFIRICSLITRDLEDHHEPKEQLQNIASSLMKSLLLKKVKKNVSYSLKIAALQQFRSELENILADVMHSPEIDLQQNLVLVQSMRLMYSICNIWPLFSLDKCLATTSKSYICQASANKVLKVILPPYPHKNFAQQQTSKFYRNLVHNNCLSLHKNLVPVYHLFHQFYLFNPKGQQVCLSIPAYIMEKAEESLEEHTFKIKKKYALNSIFEKKSLALQIVKYFFDTAQALEFIHQQGSNHGNIHLRNILLKQGRAMLGDWGFDIYRQIQEKHPSGETYHLAPEVRHFPPYYSAAADIYSLGRAMHQATFYGQEQIKPSDANPSEQLAHTLQVLTEQMTNNHPEIRPPVAEVKKRLSEILIKFEENGEIAPSTQAETISESLNFSHHHIKKALSEQVLGIPLPATLIPGQQDIPQETSHHPLLVYMEKPIFVNMITQASSLACYYAPTLFDVEMALENHTFSGILAFSPVDASQSAYQAIAKFRAHNPQGLVIYHGWDYRIEISGKKALHCQADAVMLGGVEASEFMKFLFTALKMKHNHKMPKPHINWYREFLLTTCPTSPFWELAERFREEKIPPSEYE